MEGDNLMMQTQTLEEKLKETLGNDTVVEKIENLSGGSINTAIKVKTNQGNFFAKYNRVEKGRNMFEMETHNLDLIAATRTLKTPRVISHFVCDGNDYLILEFIESGTPHYEFWTDLGFGLAHLHKTSSDHFGLDYDNYMGSMPQINKKATSWVDFFIESRLEPMLKMAIDNQRTDINMIERFQRLYLRLPEIFPTENSSLLHGDLWSGNCMSDENGDPIIYDPATYFGNREMDIAMTKLFGGFDDEFYAAYNEEYPLHPEWEHRVQICNLYPLLVHVNLFGGAYIQAVKNVVNHY